MSESHQNTQATSVTVVISRRVKVGCEAAFETFLTEVTAACGQFPGYLGSTIFRPASAADPEYRVLFRFDRLSNHVAGKPQTNDSDGSPRQRR